MFPLRDSQFEGKPVKIPYNYAWLLEEEYGRSSLTNTEFQGFADLNYSSERSLTTRQAHLRCDTSRMGARKVGMTYNFHSIST